MAQGEGEGPDGGGMIRKIVLAASIAVLPIMAVAQAPAQAAMTKARELMVVMHAEELTNKVLNTQMKAMGGGIVNQMMASGQFPSAAANDPEFRAILQRYMDKVGADVAGQVKASMPQIIEAMVRVYAKDFTPAQMDDMIAFYRTPTGQVVLARLPDTTAEVAIATRDLTMGPIMRTVQASVPQFMTELKAWADKHPQAGGAKQ